MHPLVLKEVSASCLAFMFVSEAVEVFRIYPDKIHVILHPEIPLLFFFFSTTVILHIVNIVLPPRLFQKIMVSFNRIYNKFLSAAVLPLLFSVRKRIIFIFI